MRKLIVCVLMAISLAGCWAVFIPGSVVSGASDSLTGAEGNNCVSATAKIGDRIRLPDGSAGTVKTLSGTSTRCRDSRFPIRAKLDPA